MAIALREVLVDIRKPNLSDGKGIAVFQLAQVLRDTVDHYLVGPGLLEMPYEGPFSIFLPTNDDADEAPQGWAWICTIKEETGDWTPFAFLLPFGDGSPVDFDTLATVGSDVELLAYIPVNDPAYLSLQQHALRDTGDQQVTGNLAVTDALGTKGYRFRTNGGDLDLEAAGRGVYISVWSGAGYTGTQRTYIIAESAFQLLHLIGETKIEASPGGYAVFRAHPGDAALGFYNTAPVVKPTVTGAKGGNAALTSLLTALASMGLITNSTT